MQEYEVSPWRVTYEIDKDFVKAVEKVNAFLEELDQNEHEVMSVTPMTIPTEEGLVLQFVVVHRLARLVSDDAVAEETDVT